VVHLHTGVVHKLRGNPAAALSSFSKALVLDPSYAPAYAQAGSALTRLGRNDEAIEHIRYAISLSPNDRGLALWARFAGQAELERGQDAAAIAWFKQSIALGTRQPWSHASLASAYALTGDMHGAAKQIAEVRKFAPWAIGWMKEVVARRSTGRSGPSRLWDGLKKALAEPL
jgi:tetratricopeptide (TPR) repeat protein